MSTPAIDFGQTATDFERNVRAFTEALGATKIGPKIQFKDRVEISAGDLFTAIIAELGINLFGDEDRHEWFAEQLVQRIFRDTPTSTVASRSGE